MLCVCLAFAGSAASAEPFHGRTSASAFAGVAFHAPLGRADRSPRLSLTAAPQLRTVDSEGRLSARLGEGLSLRFASGRPQVALAGKTKREWALLGDEEEAEAEKPGGPNAGLIVAGAVAVGAIVAGVLVMDRLTAGDGE